MNARSLWLGTAALLLAAVCRAGSPYLEPEQAFRVRARAVDDRRVALHVDIAPGYHLYADRFSVQSTPAAAGPVSLLVPHGQRSYDKALQREVEILQGEQEVMAVFGAPPSATVELGLRFQGCADEGLCYAPMEHRVGARPGADGMLVLTDTAAAQPLAVDAQSSLAVAQPSRSAPDEAADDRTTHALRSRSLLGVGAAFLLAGVALSLTPCLLPMLPILSSIIVGRSGKTSRTRGFALALSYSLGMAAVYTLLGVAAGWAGEGIAAWLQNGWVLGAFSLVLVALALSMFGAFELQLPSAWQTRVSGWAARFPGGQFAGVAFMGGVSGLVIGPCVAPPLAGALLYIGRTHDVLIGAVALFAMAIGMSTPLLLAGLSAGALLPRAGAWMVRVKHLFGFGLLVVAAWIVSPALPAWAHMALASLLLLAAGAYLGSVAFDTHAAPCAAAIAALAVTLAVSGVFELFGLASGGRDPWQPMSHLTTPSRMSMSAPAAKAFAPVADVEGLQGEVRRSTRPVLLDVYADWCSACKELEALTLRDAEVQAQLADFTLLRADVTANTPAQRELMKRFGLFGPPALLFFRADGRELATSRVVGYIAADELGQRLVQVARGP